MSSEPPAGPRFHFEPDPGRARAQEPAPQETPEPGNASANDDAQGVPAAPSFDVELPPRRVLHESARGNGDSGRSTDSSPVADAALFAQTQPQLEPPIEVGPGPQAQPEPATAASDGPQFAAIVAGHAPHEVDQSDAAASSRRAGEPKGSQRKRNVLIAVGAVVVLAAVGVGIAWKAGAFEPEVITVTPPAVVVQPTPVLEPTREPDGTVFYQAMPDTVADFSLIATAAQEAWVGAGAIEAYALTYSNGTDEVTVWAGQWPTADEAAAAEPIAFGAMSLAGPAVKNWQNDSALFSIQDLTETHTQAFYDAFPF